MLFEHYSNTITNRQPRSRSAMMPSIIGDERSTKNNPSHYSAGGALHGPYTGLARAKAPGSPPARRLLASPQWRASASLLRPTSRPGVRFHAPLENAGRSGGRESSGRTGERALRSGAPEVSPPVGCCCSSSWREGASSRASRQSGDCGGAGARGRGGAGETDQPARRGAGRGGARSPPSSKLRRRESRGVEGVSLPEAGGTFEREGSRRGQSERAVYKSRRTILVVAGVERVERKED